MYTQCDILLNPLQNRAAGVARGLRDDCFRRSASLSHAWTTSETAQDRNIRFYPYGTVITEVFWWPKFMVVGVPNSTTRTPANQRTSSQQFYNLLYNKFTTNGQKFATSQHLNMSRCLALALRCGTFVVEVLWARPLVVSVDGVRVVEFGPKGFTRNFGVKMGYLSLQRTNFDQYTPSSLRNSAR